MAATPTAIIFKSQSWKQTTDAQHTHTRIIIISAVWPGRMHECVYVYIKAWTVETLYFLFSSLIVIL